MSTHPLAIKVSPGDIRLPKGQLAVTEKVTVTNAGTQPVHVYAASQVVHQAVKGGCSLSAAPSWIHISNVGYLQPGKSGYSMVTVNAPQGTDGSYAAVFTAQTVAKVHGSGATMAASVGSRIDVNGTGKGVAAYCGKAAAPITHASSFPIGWVALAAVLFILAIAAGVLLVNRHRHAV